MSTLSQPATQADTPSAVTAPRARPWPACRAAPAWLAAVLVCTLAVTPGRAAAQSDLSEASGLSLLPVALVVAAPALLLSGGAQLSVTAVRHTGEGVVWVLERTSDGAQASLRLSGQASVAVGDAVRVTAVAAGWLLSVAGTAVAFVPNEIGRRLMHDERVSR